MPSPSCSMKASDQVAALSRRDFGLNARGGPRRAVSHDIEQPHQAIGRLPHDAVAQRAEGIARDGLRRCPGGAALGQARPEYRRVPRVLALATVVDEVQVAVCEIRQTRRVLVGPRRNLWTEHALRRKGRRHALATLDCRHRQGHTEERPCGPEGPREPAAGQDPADPSASVRSFRIVTDHSVASTVAFSFSMKYTQPNG